jgi:hypothetical protein
VGVLSVILIAIISLTSVNTDVYALVFTNPSQQSAALSAAQSAQSADTSSNNIIVIPPVQPAQNPNQAAIDDNLARNPLAAQAVAQAADSPVTTTNPPWKVCATAPTKADFSTVGLYSISGTAKVKLLDQGQQKVNITLINDLASGVISGKIIQDDSSQKSVKLNLDKTNGLTTECRQNVQTNSPQSGLTDLTASTIHLNPPFGSCFQNPSVQGLQTAVYTIQGSVNTQDIVNRDNGVAHLKIQLFTDFTHASLSGGIFVDEKKFGETDPIRISGVSTDTTCLVKSAFIKP